MVLARAPDPTLEGAVLEGLERLVANKPSDASYGQHVAEPIARHFSPKGALRLRALQAWVSIPRDSRPRDETVAALRRALDKAAASIGAATSVKLIDKP